MPPTSAVALVSRYAFDVTVPGTVIEAASALPRTMAVLIPARAMASGVKLTSTGSSVEETGAGGIDAGADAAWGGRLSAAGPAARRSPHTNPPSAATATPTATAVAP